MVFTQSWIKERKNHEKQKNLENWTLPGKQKHTSSAQKKIGLWKTSTTKVEKISKNEGGEANVQTFFDITDQQN